MAFTCEDIRERWPEYYYRELAEPEQSRFVNHLAECPACRREEQAWRTLLKQFDSIACLDGTMDAPPELVYRVKRQVHLFDDWSNQMQRHFRRWMIASAAACLLLAGGLAGVMLHARANGVNHSLFSPIQHSVLSTFYDSKTLELYRKQGILMEKDEVQAETIAGNPVPADSLGDGIKSKTLEPS
ncbi:MAG: anti-sigma factor [bacterium]